MIRHHRQRLALAVAGGLALAAAFPPLHLLPGLSGLAVLLALARAESSARRRFALGWVFGFAFFVGSLWWIAIAFGQGPEAYRALGIPAMLGLAAFLALGPGLLALLVRLTGPGPFARDALVLALGWVALELLRAELLRFPWNPLASTLAFSAPSLQPVAWFGTYGTDLLLALLAVLPAGLVGAPPHLRRLRALMVLVPAVPLALAGFLRLPSAPASGEGVPVRIVQPNIAQHHKWDPARRLRWLELHLELTRRPATEPPRLVLWPESAVPFRVEDPRLRERLAAALPTDAVLGFGADHVVPGDPPVLHNSFYLMDGRGRLLDRYDKVDLVPFGEFLPLGDLLAPLGLGKLTIGAVDFSPGPGRRTLEAPGLPPLSPLICYEIAFPGRATDGRGRARLLVNVTNDAWFGRSFGPYQHFALARTRAVETGLPLLRAANTGISAIVDGYGRIRAWLPLGERGVLDGRVPDPTAPPPAARHPWIAVFSALALVLLVGLLDLWAASRHKERRSRQAGDVRWRDARRKGAASDRPPRRPAAP